MAQLNNTEKQIQIAVDHGRRNQNLLPQVQAWCSHLVLKDVSGGMVAAMYKIPLSVNISCPHATGGFESMNLESIARDFILQSCENCPFHNPSNTDNFGTSVFKILNAQREAEQVHNLQVAQAKKELKENIKSLLTEQKSTAEIPQVSILKLIEGLEITETKIETAQKLLEASLLQPHFFTDSSLDVLATYFTDEEIGGTCLQLVSNILQATGKRPESCLKQATAVIGESESFDNASLLLPYYINAENLQDHKGTILSLLGRLRYDRFPGEPFGEKTYQHSEAFFISLLHIDESFLINLFTEQLLTNEKSSRINTIGLLEKVVAANTQIGLILLPQKIRSLELEDDQYMTSADKVTCLLIAKVIVAFPQPAYNILESEKMKLSHAAQLALYSVYDTLLKDKDFTYSNITITNNIVAHLLKITLDKSLDAAIRDEATDALYYSKENLAGLGKNYFDSLLGAFIQLIEEHKSFKWYVQEIETNKVSTFNPLSGMNHWDIHHHELKINGFRSHIKECLIEVIRANPGLYIPEVYAILFTLDSQNAGFLKKELITIVRQGSKDPLILSPFIPKLYNFLFDPHDKSIRVEAIRFLDHLITSVPQIVTSTLREVIEVFLSDSDPEIRGEAVGVLESLIEAAGEKATDHQMQQALKALSDRTIFVHKKALPICHDLAPYLDANKRVAFFIALAAIEPHYKNKQEFDVCRRIINCMIAVAGDDTRISGHTVTNYIVPYCMLDDTDTAKDFLGILRRMAKTLPQFNDEWLKVALDYLKRTGRDRYNPSFDSRNNIYDSVYHLSYKLIAENGNLIFETGKSIVSNDPYDAINFLFILSHFELHHLCADLCKELLSNVPATKSNASMIRFVSIIKQFSSIELQIKSGRLSPEIIEKLENETKKTTE